MKAFTSSLLASVLALSAVPALAQWSGGISYANFSDDDASLGTVNLHGAYEFVSQNSAFSYMPEVRLGFGVKDDEFRGINVAIDEFLSLGLRLSYYTSDTVSFFIVPSYARLGVSASANGFSADDSTNEFGIGGGISAQISDDMRAEASYEDYDGTGVLSIGLRYQF